ncbi:MAG: hypothetical protein J6I32_05270 [Bacteroidaceae bacterium]|nr:hypothetical protein [Bacteroidaceae bacterium]MDY6250582.1 hypothetical protein [Bacteroidaceae bacterium]
MKKMILFSFALLGLSACMPQKEQQAEKEASSAIIDSLQQALQQSQNESNDMMGTIEQIQEGFRQINEAEGRVTTQTQAGEGSDKEAIVDNMAFIQKTLRLNRELITSLQQQLRTSTQSNSKMKSTLEDMVANFQQQLDQKEQQLEALKAELAQRDVQIAEQAEQIDNLNANVSELAQKHEEKARQVAEQDKELHTAYYVFGTKKELSRQNIIDDGEVLRSKDVNRDYFTKIDLRVTKTIKLYSKHAKLRTNHPEGSYSLDKDAQGLYTLRIANPELFWSNSRYLVIVVK